MGKCNGFDLTTENKIYCLYGKYLTTFNKNKTEIRVVSFKD